jgi:hypothetical protein
MNDTNNYTNAELEEIVTKITKEGNIAPAQILQTAMNLLMVAERNMYLAKNTDHKANGYFSRKLGTGTTGTIDLQVPRVGIWGHVSRLFLIIGVLYSHILTFSIFGIVTCKPRVLSIFS